MNVTIAAILALACLSALFFLALCAAASGPMPQPPLPRHRRVSHKSTGLQGRRRSLEDDKSDDVSGRMTAGCLEK